MCRAVRKELLVYDQQAAEAELARETPPPLTPLHPVAASWKTFVPCHFLHRCRSSTNRSLGIKA